MSLAVVYMSFSPYATCARPGINYKSVVFLYLRPENTSWEYTTNSCNTQRYPTHKVFIMVLHAHVFIILFTYLSTHYGIMDLKIIHFI